MKTITNTLLKAKDSIPFLNRASDSPFEIEVRKETDLTKQSPYFLKIVIHYQDKVFKKRISNLLKSKKHILEYEIFEVNKGSLFKPIKEKQVNASIREAILDTTSASVIEAIIPFPVNISRENTISLRYIDGHAIYFEEIQTRDLVATCLLDTLNNFYLQEFKKYKDIKTE